MKLSIRRRFRIAVSAFYFIQGLVFASWASRIPDIKSALGMNEATLGGVLFAIPVGQLSAMALSGYLVSKYGSRKMLSLAVVLYPLILVMIVSVTSVWMLALALFLFGVAANLCNISVNTQGVDVEHLYNRSIMATFHGLWSLAGFLGGLISIWMVAGGLSPFIHFCIICVVSLLILMLMRNALVPRDIAPKQEKKAVFVKPDKYIILLGLIAFGSMACEGTMFDWSGVYFDEVVHAPENLLRLGYVASMFTMTLGRFIADRLITRFGVVTILRSCGICIAVGLLLSVAFPYLTTATIGFLLVGLGISASVPICYSLAGKSKTMLPGVALATVSTIGFFGFLLGPPVIGFIAQAFDLRWSFGFIACIGVMIILLAPAIKHPCKL